MNNNTPEIRFKGFTDAWEQRKFSYYLDFSVSNNTLSRAGLNYDEGEIKNIHYGDILVKFDSIIDISNPKVPFITGGKAEDYKNQLLQNGDIIIADTAEDETTGKAVEITGISDNYVVSGLHTMVARPNEAFARGYLGYYLNSQAYRNQLLPLMQGIKVLSLSKTNMAKTTIIFPKNKSEQTRIGTFFRTLDDAITLHKRKLDGLKELKKGYLQQMFPQAGESVPRARFDGFTEPWEERKLGEVVERVTRKNTKLESTLPLTISAQYGLIDQNEFFNKQVASKDVSNYFLVKKGEFAYNKSYSNGYPWGAIKRLDMYDVGVLSTLYIVFKPMEVESEFLVQYYETTNWHTQVSACAAEGARNHGLLNISPSDFFSTKLTMPKEKDEQIAIGKFFRNIDNQITTQQQKLTQLKQLKSAYLQKMFV